MSEALDRLKDIGAQRIYEETHIPIEHVQAIIHESFDGLTKLQFLGFISILEREYKEDLSGLKERGVNYFDELKVTNVESPNHTGIFVAPTPKRNFTLLYILIAFLIFSIVAYISLDTASQEDKNITIITSKNPVIEDAQKSIDFIDTNESNTSLLKKSLNEGDSSQENNRSMREEEEKQESLPLVEERLQTVQQAEVTQIEKKRVQSFKIVTQNTKVWIGYIDLDSKKKYQKIFKGELELDPVKSWLIVLGHGYVNFVLDDKIEKFDPKKELYFLYKDATLKVLTKEEFKELNGGREW